MVIIIRVTSDTQWSRGDDRQRIITNNNEKYYTFKIELINYAHNTVNEISKLSACAWVTEYESECLWPQQCSITKFIPMVTPLSGFSKLPSVIFVIKKTFLNYLLHFLNYNVFNLLQNQVTSFFCTLVVLLTDIDNQHLYYHYLRLIKSG